MTTDHPGILIIAQASRLRDSLRVLLKSTRPLIPIERAETVEAALPRLAGGPPTLVLLDAALPEGQAWQALEHIRRRYPQHRCVILAHSAGDQAQARLAGVVAVWLDGMTAAGLFAAVEGAAKYKPTQE